ncbi:ABC transporter substrate-binding protein [Trichococcus ilyis]|uniref:Iron complex transport system substrate-binding protein n=1 Tax=Trichococcus ilyis TaxID=640938 RepID=A0A143Z6F9_9LACT|nr:ABC transporter substrate-binding protein [Trichococcus ilyis]CZR07463.1 Hypothetical protein TR210_2442 [Trichococcus ilyis]SEJ74190.1 iron complex transport system substrate-binding protein [Trichococcus ilyis]
MKKLSLTMLLSAGLILGACSATDTAEESSTATETVTYTTTDGEEIAVPANPERVVVLSSYAGDLINFDVNIVGVDSWSAGNPNFSEALSGVAVVSNADVEKILELGPDLIIGLDNIENADQLSEIAPTVLFTYGELSYLDQIVEIGKVVNKEEEAVAWVEEFQTEAQAVGEEIKAAIGEDATVTVAENFEKQMYIFGDNWARGTEILYQEMGLKMPATVEETALDAGYYAISEEVLGDYIGDYLILSLATTDPESSFLDAEWFKNIPAVQNNHVFVADAETFYFNDSLSLDYQLDFFEESFLAE